MTILRVYDFFYLTKYSCPHGNVLYCSKKVLCRPPLGGNLHSWNFYWM